MDRIEYYKSVVSDEEVIQALIRDSKARDGQLEKTRVRPNLQFFQRTVSNLVSSNNRVTEQQKQVKAKEKEKNKVYRPRRCPARKKEPIDYIKEILSNKIEFVQASGSSQNNDKKSIIKSRESQIRSSTKSKIQRERMKKTFKTKSPFQQIQEILTNNTDKHSISKTNNLIEKKCNNRERIVTEIIICDSSSDSDVEICLEVNNSQTSCLSHSKRKNDTPL